MMFLRYNFHYLLIFSYTVICHWNSLSEAVPRTSHNICFLSIHMKFMIVTAQGFLPLLFRTESTLKIQIACEGYTNIR